MDPTFQLPVNQKTSESPPSIRSSGQLGATAASVTKHWLLCKLEAGKKSVAQKTKSSTSCMPGRTLRNSDFHIKPGVSTLSCFSLPISCELVFVTFGDASVDPDFPNNPGGGKSGREKIGGHA